MNDFFKMVLATMLGFFLCTVISTICYIMFVVVLGLSFAGALSTVDTNDYTTIMESSL